MKLSPRPQIKMFLETVDEERAGLTIACIAVSITDAVGVGKLDPACTVYGDNPPYPWKNGDNPPYPWKRCPGDEEAPSFPHLPESEPVGGHDKGILNKERIEDLSVFHKGSGKLLSFGGEDK